MSHVALYRKYRSQTFSDLIGQEHVVRTLQNAIKQGNIHHAFLFTGPRGTGKTSTARLLAKALNCEVGLNGEPCNTCDLCRTISEGSCMDVIELDAASEAGVDDVRRQIIDVVEYRPTIARYKVFIIDEVHDLSSKAFDALLKTIEEPPAHIVFILATTELHKVPPTIQSRCQKFSFNRGNLNDLASRLEHVLRAEGREFEPGAVQIIARMADGGFRDALSLLEQAILTSQGVLTRTHVEEQLGLIREEVLDALLVAVSRGEAVSILEHVDQIYRSGRDARGILEGLLMRLSELTRAAYGIEIGGSGEATQEAVMKATAGTLGPDHLLRLRERVANGIKDARDVSLPKLWLESLLLGYAHSLVAQPAVVAAAAPAHASSQAPTVARPAATAVVHETPTPAAPPSSEPVHSAPSTEESAPARAMPELPEDPALRPLAELWGQLVNAFSEQSRVAGALLRKTQVLRIEGKTLWIAFTRQLDLDEFKSKAKLATAVESDWAKRAADTGMILEFTVQTGVKREFSPEPAVELPAEGSRLVDLARDTFQNF